jgi:outer membrane protein
MILFSSSTKPQQMKNTLLIVNVLLVIAVATLFFLYFSKKTPQLSASVTSGSIENRQGFKIAYFEMDSIENNYNYFKDVRSKFRGKEQQLNTELQTIKNQYEKLYEEYTQIHTTLSPEEKVKREQNLVMLQESYKNKQELQGSELQSEGFKYRQEIYKKIQDYLKEFNKDKGFAFIFASNPDLFYYKDSVYNITGDLIEGLNETYKPAKKK